jgi:hypothetical protein
VDLQPRQGNIAYRSPDQGILATFLQMINNGEMPGLNDAVSRLRGTTVTDPYADMLARLVVDPVRRQYVERALAPLSRTAAAQLPRMADTLGLGRDLARGIQASLTNPLADHLLVRTALNTAPLKALMGGDVAGGMASLVGQAAAFAPGQYVVPSNVALYSRTLGNAADFAGVLRGRVLQKDSLSANTAFTRGFKAEEVMSLASFGARTGLPGFDLSGQAPDMSAAADRTGELVRLLESVRALVGGDMQEAMDAISGITSSRWVQDMKAGKIEDLKGIFTRMKAAALVFDTTGEDMMRTAYALQQASRTSYGITKQDELQGFTGGGYIDARLSARDVERLQVLQRNNPAMPAHVLVSRYTAARDMVETSQLGREAVQAGYLFEKGRIDEDAFNSYLETAVTGTEGQKVRAHDMLLLKAYGDVGKGRALRDDDEMLRQMREDTSATTAEKVRAALVKAPAREIEQRTFEESIQRMEAALSGLRQSTGLELPSMSADEERAARRAAASEVLRARGQGALADELDRMRPDQAERFLSDPVMTEHSREIDLRHRSGRVAAQRQWFRDNAAALELEDRAAGLLSTSAINDKQMAAFRSRLAAATPREVLDLGSAMTEQNLASRGSGETANARRQEREARMYGLDSSELDRVNALRAMDVSNAAAAGVEYLDVNMTEADRQIAEQQWREKIFMSRNETIRATLGQRIYDVAVGDSPLSAFGVKYSDDPEENRRAVRDIEKSTGVNLSRDMAFFEHKQDLDIAYENAARGRDEKEMRTLDSQLAGVLNDGEIPTQTIRTDKNGVTTLGELTAAEKELFTKARRTYLSMRPAPGDIEKRDAAVAEFLASGQPYEMRLLDKALNKVLSGEALSEYELNYLKPYQLMKLREVGRLQQPIRAFEGTDSAMTPEEYRKAAARHKRALEFKHDLTDEESVNELKERLAGMSDKDLNWVLGAGGTSIEKAGANSYTGDTRSAAIETFLKGLPGQGMDVVSKVAELLKPADKPEVDSISKFFEALVKFIGEHVFKITGDLTLRRDEATVSANWP